MCIKAARVAEAQGLPMQSLPTRHGRMALEIAGAGTPFVLLHSGGHDRHDFDAIVRPLGRRFRTIAIDLLGHGDSAHVAPPSNIDVAKICEAVEDVVVALDLPPALVLGNSVGGTAALHLACKHPARVRGLVLVSTSGLIEQTRLARAFCAIQGTSWIRRHAGMAFARSYLKGKSEHTATLLERMQARRGDRDFIAMEAALWRSFGRPESDLSAFASSVRCPTALVWGRYDPVLRARIEGARARRLLPHAQWIELDAGHVPFVETPDAFLTAIEPFIASHAAPASARSAPV
jgi:pimeloyl-ACP methyl ester carboxylesterase